MATFNAKAHLRTMTEWGAKNIVNDLNAIAEDKRGESPGGSVRAPLNIVAECGVVNSFVAKTLRGETSECPAREQREAFLKSFDTTEKALAFLKQETESLLAAIDELDESTLNDIVPTPLGERSRFALAEIPAMHMSYHDGQLNYIQTLRGDEEMHWA